VTFAQCPFLASLYRRRYTVLSRVVEIALPYRLLLGFFGILHIFGIQKYTERNLGPLTRLPHTALRRISD
jgi:hypothetical protein